MRTFFPAAYLAEAAKFEQYRTPHPPAAKQPERINVAARAEAFKRLLRASGR